MKKIAAAIALALALGGCAHLRDVWEIPPSPTERGDVVCIPENPCPHRGSNDVEG